MFYGRFLFSLRLVVVIALASGLSTTGNEKGRRRVDSHPTTAWTVPSGVKFGSLDKLQRLPIAITRDGDNDQDYNGDDDDDDDAESPAVTVATCAIGLNFADIFSVLGLYNAANQVRGQAKGAFIPGLEFSGTVLSEENSRGTGTSTFARGDAVLGFTRFGAYSDVVKTSPAYLLPLPKTWSFLEGASFIVQALTAWHGLIEVGDMPNLMATNTGRDSDIENMQRERPYIVIVHSAAGGVGLWASEIAARGGATVIGIVGDDPKKQAAFYERIRPLSPQSRAMVRGNEASFARRLAECLQEVHYNDINDSDVKKTRSLSELAEEGLGADMVMECLGGKYMQASFDSLNSRGALVTYGSTSYVSPGKGLNLFRLVYRYLTRPRIDPGQLTSRNIRLGGFNLIFLTEQQEELRQQLQACIHCLSGGTGNLADVTRPVIGSAFDFEQETVEAMEHLKSGQTVGKVVLDNSNNPFLPR